MKKVKNKIGIGVELDQHRSLRLQTLAGITLGKPITGKNADDMSFLEKFYIAICLTRRTPTFLKINYKSLRSLWCQFPFGWGDNIFDLFPKDEKVLFKVMKVGISSYLYSCKPPEGQWKLAVLPSFGT